MRDCSSMMGTSGAAAASSEASGATGSSSAVEGQLGRGRVNTANTGSWSRGIEGDTLRFAVATLLLFCYETLIHFTKNNSSPHL